ncbi:hypothetical protein ACFT38_00650 [Streptomyces sp. NPDC056975]|uniref:hypothetical protein n=1 Tax=Streptomyces sp. NPDC056975 TaxID=3345985 RepID=UPI00362570B4
MEYEDGLRALFPDKAAADALVRWAQYGGHGGVVEPLSWRASGGASGALLAAVIVSPEPGPLIAKVSAPGRPGEAQAHAHAQRTAPRRVTPQWDTWDVADDRVLTFQLPAGNSLRDVRTLAALGDQLPQALQYVTRWLLTEWNTTLGAHPGTTPLTTLLGDELDAELRSGGSAAAYGARVDGLAEETAWIRVDGRDLPNPLALAVGGYDLPDPALRVLRGRAHGDLHLENVMVPLRMNEPSVENFQLIDLATYAPDAPLSRDVAMLLVSALVPEVRRLAAGGGDAGAALLRCLVAPETTLRNHIVPSAWQLADAVRQECAAAVGNWSDAWHEQFLASLLATGLRFSTYVNMGDAARWWFFRLAAHAGGALLALHDDRPPLAGRPVFPPAPASTGGTNGSTGGPDGAAPAPSGGPGSVAIRPANFAFAAAPTSATGESTNTPRPLEPATELRKLEAYSREAVAAAGHQGASGIGARPLDLEALSVPRTLERSLLPLLREGGSACITGPAGTGKTTLLWRLHQQLAADPDGPRPYFLRAGDLWDGAQGTELALGTLQAAAKQLDGPAVFLFDTADLLVSDRTGIVRLQELLTVAAENSVRVLMSCREEEAHVLKPYVSGFALQWRGLGPYDPGEQEAAIRSHARYFYEGEPEVSVDEVCRTVANAAVHGLPMHEVCRAPLTLRMLFEAFAPKPPLVEEIDATTLYSLYWEHRVGRDQRAGDAPSPVAAADLSATGEELARLMLQEGRLDLSADEAGAGIAPSPGAPSPADIPLLMTRGVIECHGSGIRRYSYFHQTLFEYAAGRRLSRAPNQLGALLDWLKEYPDDHFRLAVAEQALVQAGRAGGARAETCTALLTGLLDSTWDDTPAFHALRAMQLRVYARLPTPDAALRVRFAPVLAALPPVLGQVYLNALPATCNQNRERVADELLAIWRTEHQEVRRSLLVALGWLAESTPDGVVAVIERSCPSRGRGYCDSGRCAPRTCLWAWLLTQHKTEVFKFVSVLEALAGKRPEWVWPRLRILLTDLSGDLSLVARCVRLAARPYDWPERPYTVIRPVVQHRWSLQRPRNKNGVELQAALGRLIAAGWSGGGRRPSQEAVLAASARSWQDPRSYPQVRAVGVVAAESSAEEVQSLLEVVERVGSPGAMPLLTDALLLPLLTDARGPAGTVGGDTSSGPATSPEPAATATVRAWLAGHLRALDGPAQDGFGHRLAEHTWSRSMDVATTARLVGEAWPRTGPDAGPGRPDQAEERLRRVWLAEDSAVTLLATAAVAEHPEALDALRLWRTERAAGHDLKGAARKHAVSQVDQEINSGLQRLLPDFPELLDELFSDGMVDPWIDPGWLNEALRRADVGRESPQLNAALRRHAAALERLCDTTWTGDYGPQVARKAIPLRGKLVARGILAAPSASQLGDLLARGGHPHRLRTVLLLIETVVGHSPHRSLDTPDWRRLEDTLRDFLRPAYTADRVPPTLGWYEDNQVVVRRCLTGLVCRHHPLDTPRRAARACADAARHLARAHEVDEVTVLGRLVERLATASPAHAVQLVADTATRVRELPTGKEMSLAQRWYRPLTILVERADTEQWRRLVEGCLPGPQELMRVLIRTSIRKRPGSGAHLLKIADTSPWPDVVRETVRIGTLLSTAGSRRRWAPPAGA